MVVSGIYNAQSFTSLKLLFLDKYPMLNVERKFRWAFWCSEILRIFFAEMWAWHLSIHSCQNCMCSKDNRLQEIQQPPLKTRHQREPQDNFAKMKTIKWDIFFCFWVFWDKFSLLRHGCFWSQRSTYLCLPRLWSEGVCHCARFSGIVWALLFQEKI